MRHSSCHHAEIDERQSGDCRRIGHFCRLRRFDNRLYVASAVFFIYLTLEAQVSGATMRRVAVIAMMTASFTLRYCRHETLFVIDV